MALPGPAGGRRRPGLGPRVRVLATALFLYGFGQELWFRYLPAYLRALGLSALGVGLFGALKDFLDAAYAYPGGVLADRLGAGRALVLFGALGAAGFGILFFWPSAAGIFVGLFFVLCWPALGLPATFSLIGEDLDGGRRITGFTVQAVLKRIPIVAAPPLGGLLLERLGMRNGMRAGFAASVVISLAALAALTRGLRKAGGAGVSKERRSFARASKVRLDPALKQLLIADCLVRLCEGLPEVFVVIWAIEVVRVSPAGFGLLTSVLMATAIVSYLPAVALAERAEKKSFILLTYFFFSLFPLAVLWSRSFAGLAAAFAIGGLREIGEPARKALIVELCAPGGRGRTVGLYYTIRGFAVAGAAAAGGVLWTVRPALTFLVAAALGVLGTAWAALFLPSKK